MVTTLSTFWVSMPTANLTTDDGTTASGPVSFLQNGLGTWTLTLAVLAVILGGIRTVWEQRGGPLKDMLRSLLTLTLVSGLGLGVIAILVVAADAFSASIISTATDGKGFTEALKLLVLTNSAGTAVFLMIVLGLIGLLTSLVQIVLMVVRSGMLVILAGILPTTAAFTNTEMGRQWFQKAVGWTLAFILYKPAAAIVYAVAFKLMGSSNGTNGLADSITGFALMVVAVLALPALMRFVTPMVGAVAAGSGGGAAAGAAMGAVATGAVSMGHAGSGRGNASPTPASSSSGSGASAGSASGSSGSGGGGGGSARPSPAAGRPPASTGGASGTASGAAASSGAASGGAAASTAGTAAGPVGAAAVAGIRVATRAGQAVRQGAQDSTGQSATPEGPSGSNQ